MKEIFEILVQAPELIKTPFGFLMVIGLITYLIYKLIDNKSSKDTANILQANQALKELANSHITNAQMLHEHGKDLMDRVDSLYDRASRMSQEVADLKAQLTSERVENEQNIARMSDNFNRLQTTYNFSIKKLQRVISIVIYSATAEERIRLIRSELNIEPDGSSILNLEPLCSPFQKETTAQ